MLFNPSDPKWRKKNLPAQVLFLQLESQTDQDKLLNTLGRTVVVPGSKNMKTFDSSQAELDWCIYHKVTGRKTDYTVELFGLPYSATKLDIQTFFQPLVPVDVRIFGQGNALVDFATSGDVDKALGRDKEYIGSRYVRIHKLASRTVDEGEDFKWPAPLS